MTMTRKEAIRRLDGIKSLYPYENNQHKEAIDMAIEALSAPSGDLISRADAIETVCEWGTNEERKGNLTATMVSVKQCVADILSALPSANIIEFDFNKHQPRVRNKVHDALPADAEYRTTVPPLPKGQVIVSQKGGNNRNGDDCDGIMPLCRTCTQDVSDWRLCRRICCKYGDDCDGEIDDE